MLLGLSMQWGGARTFFRKVSTDNTWIVLGLYLDSTRIVLGWYLDVSGTVNAVGRGQDFLKDQGLTLSTPGLVKTMFFERSQSLSSERG